MVYLVRSFRRGRCFYRLLCIYIYDESVKRYFDAYDIRIASHFMLTQS